MIQIARHANKSIYVRKRILIHIYWLKPFKINKSYEHWEKNFDSHREIQAAAGMTPLYRGRSEDDPQKVCIVVRMADEEKAANFMEENKDAILESGHILETTERTVYIG